MAFDLNIMRQDIKTGTIQIAGQGAGGPKIGAGTFAVTLEKCDFGAAFNKPTAKRGLLQLKVLEVKDNRSGVAEETLIGGTFNHYLPTNPVQYLAENIALCAAIADSAGMDIWKIILAMAPESEEEVLSSMLSVMNSKLAGKGKVKVLVDRRPQANSDKYFQNKFVFADSFTESDLEEEDPFN